MDEISIRSHWVSAWSTSPIDASLSETGVLDRLGVAVTDVSARTAVQLTAGGTHVRLTLSNVFGVLPLHVAACTVAIGADDARGIEPDTLRTVTFGGERRVRIAAGTSCTSDAAALPVTAGQTLTVTVFYRGINAMRTIGLIGGCSCAELGNCTRRPLLHLAIPMQQGAAHMRSSQRSRRSTCWQRPGRTRASSSATRPWQTSCRVCWRRACAPTGSKT